jgi:magnesium chelatase family protein
VAASIETAEFAQFRSGSSRAIRALVVAKSTTASHILGAPLGIATAHAGVLVGLEAHPIRIEVCCTRGPAFFQMVGLAEAAVREARVRVASALAGLSVLLDEYAVTVNLAPADLRKSGATLDVAIAAAALAAIGELPAPALKDVLILGELSLDGAIRPVHGVLPQLLAGPSLGVRTAIVPAGNAREAGLAQQVQVHIAASLREVVEHLRGQRALPLVPSVTFVPSGDTSAGGDLSDVRGQACARRALEIAAAGAHNLLLVGTPGSGKTLLARLLPTILPPLSFEEALECSMIHSVAGLLPPEAGFVSVRPFRAPHHSVSEAGLVGGGDLPRPGEISLAHNGVLFLDELAEFRRTTLESLRQPLEDGRVCIARARARAWFPARSLLVGAVNPCPCGYWGHPRRSCRCTDDARLRYQARLSGPLLDRLDIHVSVPPVEVSALTSRGDSESSRAVRERVSLARTVQRQRAEELGLGSSTNAGLGHRELGAVAALNAKSRRLIEAAMNQLGLSARAYTKILRVARTIADLEREPLVRTEHVAEAIQCRLFDRQNRG